jgi:hypothetical protein
MSLQLYMEDKSNTGSYLDTFVNISLLILENMNLESCLASLV